MIKLKRFTASNSEHVQLARDETHCIFSDPKTASMFKGKLREVFFQSWPDYIIEVEIQEGSVIKTKNIDALGIYFTPVEVEYNEE